MFNIFIPIIICIAAILTLYASKPERKNIAFVATILIIVPSLWQSFNEYNLYNSRTIRRNLAYDRLSLHQYRFLSVLAELSFYGSKEDFPKTIDEFFSMKTATLLCSGINVDNLAPVLPEKKWYEYMSASAKEYIFGLSEVYKNYSDVLNKKELSKIHAIIETNMCEMIFNARVDTNKFDIKRNISRAPLLCWGLEKPMHDVLVIIYELQKDIMNSEKHRKISKYNHWLKYPDNSSARGRFRFTKKI
jgi:hypothetical protein